VEIKRMIADKIPEYLNVKSMLIEKRCKELLNEK